MYKKQFIRGDNLLTLESPTPQLVINTFNVPTRPLKEDWPILHEYIPDRISHVFVQMEYDFLTNRGTIVIPGLLPPQILFGDAMLTFIQDVKLNWDISEFLTHSERQGI